MTNQAPEAQESRGVEFVKEGLAKVCRLRRAGPKMMTSVSLLILISSEFDVMAQDGVPTIEALPSPLDLSRIG